MIQFSKINNHVHKQMVIQSISPCMKSHQIQALEICSKVCLILQHFINNISTFFLLAIHTATTVLLS